MASKKTIAKLPPQNIAAEESVLGALMIDKHAMSKIADMLAGEDFYKAAHQIIFDVMLRLYEKNEPIDVLSVSSKLKERDELKDIGGLTALTSLVNKVPTSSHILHYAKLVKSKRTLRELISTASEIATDAFDEPDDIDSFLDNVEQKLFHISQSSSQKQFISIKDTLPEAFSRFEKLQQNSGTGLRGITTGFHDLDGILSGLQKSDLVVLGARPSLGKTTLALDIARNAAIKSNTPV